MTENALSNDSRAKLVEARHRIDQIDKQLVQLLSQRMDVIVDIAAVKAEEELPILDTAREQQKIDAIAELTSPNYRVYLKSLFGSIMDESKAFMFDRLSAETASVEAERKLEADLARPAFEDADIVIIGMPASGKSSVGARVAELLNRPFVDVDVEIVNREGVPIPEIFQRGGEPEFRRVETEVTTDVATRRGAVISCGGGVVTQSRNYAPLHRSGIIVRLTRPLEYLVSDGRPMSQLKGNEQLLKERDHLYRAWADVTVDNVGTVDDAASKIIDAARAYFA